MLFKFKRLTYGLIGLSLVLGLVANVSAQNVFQGEIVARSGVTIESGNLNLQGNVVDFNQGRSKIYDNGEMHIATDNGLYLDGQSVYIRNYLKFLDEDGDTSTISRDRNGRLQMITDEMLVLHSPHTRVSDDLYVGHWDEFITNSNFDVNGNDLYVHGDAGVRGNIYSNNCVVTGSTTSYCDENIGSSGNMTLKLGNSGSNNFRITDGSGNTLFQVTDNGTTGDATLTGDLMVNGDGTFGGNLDVAGDSHLMGELLVDGPVSLSDTLEVDGFVMLNDDLEVAGSTFIGSELEVDGDAFFNDDVDISDSLDVFGDTELSGFLTVFDQAFFLEDVEMDQDLTVFGTANFDQDINVSDNANIGGNLDVDGTTNLDGDVTLGNDLDVTGDATVGEDLDVTNDTNIGGDLDVTGSTTLDGQTTINNDLDVNGNTDLNGTVDVTGDATFDQDVQVGVNLTVTEDVLVGDELTVTGITNLLSDLNVTGPVTLLDDLQVAGDTELLGELTVFDTTVLNGETTINDNLIVNGNTTFNGDTEITGTLTVDTIEVDGPPIEVDSGGTGNSSFTAGGVLYGDGTNPILTTLAPTAGQVLLGNAGGVPTFTTISGDITISGTGVATIQPNSVALGADTTGDYVAGATSGNGITVTGSGGEGSTPSFALGPLTSNWDQTGAFDIVLNNASSELRILESAGNTFFGTIDVTDLVADRTYTLPDENGTFCTTGSICSGYAPDSGSTAYATRELDNLTTTAINADLNPDANDTYDLGSDTLRWQDIYLGPSTMHIGTSTSDEGSIFFDTALDTLNVAVDGTAHLAISDTGNVGIGTTSPDYKLHIQGDDDVNSEVVIRTSTTDVGEGGVLRLDKSRGIAGAPTIVSAGDMVGAITGRGYNGSSFENVSSILFSVEGTPAAGNMEGNILFQTANNGENGGGQIGRMMIAANGRVGIGSGIVGVGSPAQLVHVSENVNSNTQVHVENANSGSAATAVLSVQSDGAQGSLIAHSTTFPTFADRISLVAETGSGGLDLRAQDAAGTISFYTGGTNLRGTWDAAGDLDVNGSITAVSGNITAQGAAGVSFIDTGVTAVSNATALCYDSVTGEFGDCASDARLKTNIDYSGISGLSIVEQLKPVTFDFINGTKDHSGFIAQDVQKIVPSLVGKSANNYLTLKHIEIIPYTVKAIQELADKIENLEVTNIKIETDSIKIDIANVKSELTTVKGEVAGLKDRVSSLESASGTAPVQYPAKTDLSVSVGATEMTINWTDPVITDKYSVFITPTWDTNFWISAKNSTSFTVNFGNPAPAGAKLDYKVEIQK